VQIKAVEILPSAPPNSNHFQFDSYHMGADVANDLLVMYGDFANNAYIILCNKVTGERTRIWLDLEPIDPVKGYWHIGRFVPEHWSRTDETIPIVAYQVNNTLK